MRAQLLSQAEKERLSKSALVATKLRKIDSFKKAKTVMFYYALKEEIDTLELILEALQKNKKVLLPYADKTSGSINPAEIKNLDRDLISGAYGIMEPKAEIRSPFSLNEIDVVLVPGLAFDHAKYRLGRGKGYYDRFLAKLPRKVVTIGLAFNFQIVKALPVTELDVPVSQVVHS